MTAKGKSVIKFEEWRYIPGFNRQYMVSSSGKVISLGRPIGGYSFSYINEVK